MEKKGEMKPSKAKTKKKKPKVAPEATTKPCREIVMNLSAEQMRNQRLRAARAKVSLAFRKRLRDLLESAAQTAQPLETVQGFCTAAERMQALRERILAKRMRTAIEPQHLDKASPPNRQVSHALASEECLTTVPPTVLPLSVQSFHSGAGCACLLDLDDATIEELFAGSTGAIPCIGHGDAVLGIAG